MNPPDLLFSASILFGVVGFAVGMILGVRLGMRNVTRNYNHPKPPPLPKRYSIDS